MKKVEKLAESFDGIADKYIQEAVPDEKAGQARKKIIKLSLIAALITALALVLFVPISSAPPSVKRYSGSEYYNVIEKLNEVSYIKPSYKNNYQRLIRMTHDLKYYGEGIETPMPEPGSAPGSQTYREVTDNQTAGIIEGDRIKMSDRYIYAINGDRINAYEIMSMPEGYKESFYSENGRYPTLYDAFGDSAVRTVGSYTIGGGNSGYLSSGALSEMFLSSDCTRLTVLLCTYGTYGGMTDVLVLDVSDPSHIRKVSRCSLSGSYISSRMENDRLTVFTDFIVYTRSGDYSDQKSFLPHYVAEKTIKEAVYVSPDKIIFPEQKLSEARYTVIYSFEKDSPVPEDMTALLSYTNGVYVSKDNIYIARTFSEPDEAGDPIPFTETVRIERAGGSLISRGSLRVEGTIKDQYSFDEYGGVLRVVTTTLKAGRGERIDRLNASLFLVDVNTMEVISSVKNFAPDGEEVKSVRFDKDKAYVCTAKGTLRFTDPVFFFDLSDPDNITFTNTGTIPGYSLSLVNFRDGFLLGVGFGENGDVFKAEVYSEMNGEVVPVSKFEFETSGFARNYKSYYIDRENGLVGFAFTDLFRESRYILLQFDGERIREAAETKLNRVDPDSVRGVVIEGSLCVFGAGEPVIVPPDPAPGN